jgi:hypothetical protein
MWVDGDDALYLLANTLHKDKIFVKSTANKWTGVFVTLADKQHNGRNFSSNFRSESSLPFGKTSPAV